MNNNLFIILVCILVLGLFINSNKIKLIQKMENMKDCSLNDKTILENPIFHDLKQISSHKFNNYITDFNNNVIDNQVIIGDLLDTQNIYKLQYIINSYRVFDPVFNIKLEEDMSIKDIKNIILKTIILNHLKCFGDEDSHLFWTRLHLMNKEYQPFKTDIFNDPIIEMFQESNNYVINDDSNIISFYKHQQNITKVLIDKYPILKKISNDYTLIYQNKLHDIIILILNYIINNENLNKEDFTELKHLYIDLRELVLINQIMKNNQNYHFGYSNDNKTFILNHKLFIENHKNLYDKLLSNINSFEKLFNKHPIASTNKKNIRNVFLLKLKTYLKYNGIKLENNNEFILLDINSINLKHLPINKFNNKELNQEFIDLLSGKHNDNLSFRIKQSEIFTKNTKQ